MSVLPLVPPVSGPDKMLQIIGLLKVCNIGTESIIKVDRVEMLEVKNVLTNSSSY